MIHKLQDLCYAYRVADPVRDMLFALQDRITELEAQRKPLTDDAKRLEWLMRSVSGRELRRIGVFYVNGCTREDIDSAIEAAHGIKEGT